MTPSAKGTHIVSESSNKFTNPNHSFVIAPPEAPTRGGAPVAETPEQPEQRPGKKNKLRNALIGAGTIAAIGISAGLVGVNLANNGEKDPQGTETSAPVDPSEEAPTTGSEVEEQPTTPEADYTVESLALSADLLNDPELFMETFLQERMTDWINSGATPENAALAREQGDAPGLANQIAYEYDLIFQEALLAPGWDSNPELVRYVENLEKIHADTLLLYFLTSMPDLTPEDKVPYERVINFDSLISFTTNADGSIAGQNTEFDSDNKDQNSVGERGGTQGVVGNIASPTRTFIVDNGTVKLQNIILG